MYLINPLPLPITLESFISKTDFVGREVVAVRFPNKLCHTRMARPMGRRTATTGTRKIPHYTQLNNHNTSNDPSKGGAPTDGLHRNQPVPNPSMYRFLI